MPVSKLCRKLSMGAACSALRGIEVAYEAVR